MKKFTLSVLFAFAGILIMLTQTVVKQTATAQVQTYNIAPRTTDNRIDTATKDHYVFINRTIPSRKHLVVFFPGTDGEPKNYRVFSSAAANLGFHTIGLMYPNDEQVNFRCGSFSTDLDCHGAVRGETLDGTDRTDKITITRANSIENRLVRLLQYLHRLYPNDNWAQYLERSSGGDTVPQWSAIIVVGHSQGGSYAGYVATVKRVSRAIMFCAMDYNGASGRVANWMTGTKATPKEDFFAVGHERDEVARYDILSGIAWSAFGLSSRDAIVNADRREAPFQKGRFFSTNQESSAVGRLLTSTPLHNMPAVDINIPQENSRFVFQSLWEYMLTTPSLATSVREPLHSQEECTIAPNPSTNLIHIEGVRTMTGGKGEIIVTLTNLLGQMVMINNTRHLPTTLDVSSLPNGVYRLGIRSTVPPQTFPAKMVHIIH